MVASWPSSVKLKRWSVSSRAASDQSRAPWAWRTASTIAPFSSEPPGGASVQVGNLVGCGSSELEAQEVREQLVVAKPSALRIERDDESVGVLELEQEPLAAGSTGEQVCKLTVDPVQQRCSKQHVADVVRLTLEHLGDQVLPDGPIGSGELGDETLGVGVAFQRYGGQAQAGGPAFRASVQPGRVVGG